MRIVIPGGTGQVGTILARHFHRLGHSVTVIARSPKQTEWQCIQWDGHSLGPWVQALEDSDLVINLAGRSVNCRYNTANRQEIKESRLTATRLVGEAIARSTNPPSVWMNASTATIYRHSLDLPMDETRGELGGSEPNVPSAWRFSIDVARSWEKTFFDFETPGTRKIALRSAMTMSPDPGGIFDVLLGLVRQGLGGAAGSGTQYVSWIHEFDLIRAIDFLFERDDLCGSINVCSPNPIPNAEFMHQLRKAACARVGLPATRWMLEIGAVFLRTETELVLKSRRVVPRRLQAAGFTFHFPEWAGAAKELYERWCEGHGHPFGG